MPRYNMMIRRFLSILTKEREFLIQICPKSDLTRVKMLISTCKVRENEAEGQVVWKLIRKLILQFITDALLTYKA